MPLYYVFINSDFTIMSFINRLIAKQYQITLESAPIITGATAVEREKTFYCQIANFAELERADSIVEQEQWEIRPKETNAGVVRVRKTSDGELSLATKVFQGDSRLETEITITEDIFNGFRAIAPGGMLKTRYVFNIPNTTLKWEIDVYANADGVESEWCKVDLECDDLDMENPPFPITFNQVISGKRDTMSDEHRALIDNLFKTVFITKNPAIK